MRKKRAEHYPTADADKVPVARKLIYAQGDILAVIGNHVVMEMAGKRCQSYKLMFMV
jgi:hypothetical protein